MKKMLIILHGEPRGLNIKPVIEPNVLDVLLDKNSDIVRSFDKVDIYWNIPDGDIKGTIREVVDNNGDIVSINSILGTKDIEKNINRYISKFEDKIDKSIIVWRTNSLHRFDSYYTDALKYGYENYTHIILTRPDIKLEEIKNFDIWGHRFTNWIAAIHNIHTNSQIYIPADWLDMNKNNELSGKIDYERIGQRSYEIMFVNNTSLKFIHDIILSINSNIDYDRKKDYINKYIDQRFNIGETFWEHILRTFAMAIGALHMMPFVVTIRNNKINHD
jgi:hypothetical protein